MARRLVLVVLLALSSGAALAAAQACSLPAERRTDCGYVGIGQAECEASGCCWSPLTLPGQDVPWCFYKDMDACRGYEVIARRETATGFELTLNNSSPYARAHARPERARRAVQPLTWPGQALGV